MTMIQNEQLKHGQQEKWFKNFHENLDLNVTAQELEQQHPDLKWELSENCRSQYDELSGKIEKHRHNISLKAQQQGNHPEGCLNDLLILAQSAEIVAQSEDSVAGVHTNNQENKVTRTHLTQIRKKARSKYLIFNQERAENSYCKHSQGKTIRLNQIKHQARCKSKNSLSPQTITGPKNEQPKGRILRLSQMKHRARSKGNSTVKDGTEKHLDQSLPCNNFKDNEKVIAGKVVKKNICQGDSNPSVESVPAHNFYRGTSQSSVVRWDIENLKECQRTARRLRALKIKKLRQQLRTECKRNYSSAAGLHVMGTGLTGLTANSEAQEEFIPVKRLRLTQLRREARLGNPFPAIM